MRTIGRALKAIFFITIFFLGIMFIFLRVDTPLRAQFVDNVYLTLIQPYERTIPVSSYKRNYCREEYPSYSDSGLTSAEVDEGIELVRQSNGAEEKCRGINRLNSANYRDQRRVLDYIASLSDDASPDVRYFIARDLPQFPLYGKEREEIGLPVLTKYLSDSDPGVREAAIAGIRSVSWNSEKTSTILKNAYPQADTESKVHIAQEIINIEYNDADAQKWLAELYDEFPEHRLSIVSSIGGNTRTRSIPLLLRAAKEGDSATRKAAIENLAGYVAADPQIEPFLISLAGDPDSEIRNATTQSLLRIFKKSDSVREKLAELANDPDPEIRALVKPVTIHEPIPGLDGPKVLMPKNITPYLETSKEELTIGRSETIKFCVLNNTDKTFSYTSGGDYRGYRPTRFEVVGFDEDGKSVEDPEPKWLISIGGGLMGGERVEPGAKNCQPVDIFRYLAIGKPGKYKISIAYDFYYEYTPDNPKPHATKEIIFRLPSEEEARQIVADIMTRLSLRTSKGRVPQGADTEVIRHNIYLRPLLDVVDTHRADAVEAIGNIATVQATEVLLQLTGSKDPETREAAIKAFAERIPVKKDSPGSMLRRFAWNLEMHGQKSKKSWNEKFREPARKLVKELLGSELERERAAGFEMAMMLNLRKECSVLDDAEREKFTKEIIGGGHLSWEQVTLTNWLKKSLNEK